MGLEKMTAQMTVDQRGAIAVFEGMGFRAEALLANQVRTVTARSTTSSFWATT